MTCTWYTHLLGQIEINAKGIVAKNLQTILDKAIFQELPVSRDLDSNLPSDVTKWFTTFFNPWFAQLSTALEVGNNKEELISEAYTNHINEIITALCVSRAFYAKTADSEYITSLKNVGLHKASICEEVAKSVGLAFEEALNQFGDEIEGRSIEITTASTYLGSTPEKFPWNGNVLVNHVKYEDIKIMENQVNNQTPAGNCGDNREYLPWVFCAAFGLIAWSAAAKDTNKQQRSTTNSK